MINTNHQPRYTIDAEHRPGWTHITDNVHSLTLFWQGTPEQAHMHVERMNATPDAHYCSQCLELVEMLYTRGKHTYCSYCYMSQFD